MSPDEDKIARLLLGSNFPNMVFASIVQSFETGERVLLAQEKGKFDVHFDGLDKVTTFIAGTLWN